MDKELIEKLKKNERAFGLLSKEEQKAFRLTGKENSKVYFVINPFLPALRQMFNKFCIYFYY